VTIAYPDEGAWKRFHYQFKDEGYPEVICTKVRDGAKRIVRLKVRTNCCWRCQDAALVVGSGWCWVTVQHASWTAGRIWCPWGDGGCTEGCQGMCIPPCLACRLLPCWHSNVGLCQLASRAAVVLLLPPAGG
jgi:hypothetical protein